MKNTSTSLKNDLTRFFSFWYSFNGRDFPWRDSGTTAYQLLVTEILLQQTQAAKVATIWQEFMTLYPTVYDLLAAQPTDLVDLIGILGFGKMRATALKSVAFTIVADHGGIVPRSEEDLLALSRVGLYTARAVLCFGFDVPRPIVDSNVLRLFGRITGTPVKKPYDNRRNSWAWSFAELVLPTEPTLAKQHNFGILDFSAVVCKPQPKCTKCPLLLACTYGRDRLYHESTGRATD